MVSIRQAKWIALLRRQVCDEDERVRLDRLAKVADLYASYEAYVGPGDPITTTELDAALNLQRDVYHAAVEAGLIQPMFFSGLIADTDPESRLDWSGDLSLMIFEIAPYADIDDKNVANRKIKADLERVPPPLRDPWLGVVVNIRDTGLTAFRQRGQRWDELTDKEKLDVVPATTNEVVTHMWDITNHFSRETNRFWNRPYRPSEKLGARVGLVLQSV